MANDSDKKYFAVYRFKTITQYLILEKLPTEYHELLQEYEYEFNRDLLPTYLEVWKTKERTDEPFKYIPTESEQRMIQNVVRQMM